MSRPLFAESTSHARKVAAQLKLLKAAEASGDSLSDVLNQAGWSYDDLVYRKTEPKSWQSSEPLSLDDVRTAETGVPLVSFFTGCGGMDLGLEAAGYSQVASFEINELFCKTLRRNRPNWKVFGPPTHSGDVSKFEEITSSLRPLLPSSFDGVFVGGPPCQPFSIASNQRFAKWGDNFKRTGFCS
jgi:DNA (cytosine-5)-methyltransferase 1